MSIKKEGKKKKTVYQSRHLGVKVTVIATAVLLIACLGAWYYIETTYTVNTVYVEGNAHYTNEEITDRIMTGRLGRNSIYLNFKYRDKKIEKWG